MNIDFEAIYHNLIATFDLREKVLFEDLIYKNLKEVVFKGENRPEISEYFNKVKINLISRINKEIERKNYRGEIPRFYFDTHELYLIGCAYLYDDDTEADIKRKKLLSNSFFIEKELKTISDYEFEKICALILKEVGCSLYNVTRKYGDAGIDFFGTIIVNDRAIEFIDNKHFLKNSNIHFIGQSKRYTGKNLIKPKDIREFLGSIFILEFSQGWNLQDKLNIKNLPSNYLKPVEPKIPIFMTTSYFTENTEKLCYELGIIIKNGEEISRWLSFNIFQDIEIDEYNLRNTLFKYITTNELKGV